MKPVPSIECGCRGESTSLLMEHMQFRGHRRIRHMKRRNLYWSCIVRRPCVVRPCIEFPFYCSAPFTLSATTQVQDTHHPSLWLPMQTVLSKGAGCAGWGRHPFLQCHFRPPALKKQTILAPKMWAREP